jgi:uncharacterized iron-regulated membrane protein
MKGSGYFMLSQRRAKGAARVARARKHEKQSRRKLIAFGAWAVQLFIGSGRGFPAAAILIGILVTDLSGLSYTEEGMSPVQS